MSFKRDLVGLDAVFLRGHKDDEGVLLKDRNFKNWVPPRSSTKGPLVEQRAGVAELPLRRVE